MSKIFVINVDENVTRWEKISEEMKQQNMSCQRFPAIKPTWELLQDYMSNLSPSFLKYLLESHPSYTLGAIGCFLSHRYLWKLCAESNQIFGIFEDDISFTTKDFRNKLDEQGSLKQKLDKPSVNKNKSLGFQFFERKIDEYFTDV